MDNAYNLTAQDKAELADIEASQADAKLRRKRFFTKLRQRAFRARKRIGKDKENG